MTCANQGISLRGHGDEKQAGNLWNLVPLGSRFNKDAKKYFSNDSNSKIKFLSPGIQNEMIKLLADNLLNFFLSKIREESTAGQAKAEGRFFYSCIMDETQDIRRREQVSVCERYVDAELTPTKVFLEFFYTITTEAEALLTVLKEALVSLNPQFGNLRRQGYDGAANMSGCEHGLQAKVREENPRALWMYCFGHNLNLVVQDRMKDRDMENAIQKTRSVITFIEASSKRYEVFKKMAAQEDHYDRRKIRPLCPTRWAMRLASVDSMLLHYTTVLMQLEIALDDRELKPDKRAEARAFIRSLEELNTHFVAEHSGSYCSSPTPFM
ncbi:Zinc finger MYM-type protein 1-like [Oopsacas minuta]|uniref:Zinc finger MYM-type protein 1-like n=1 Tax=Oopsacas minuta TaxID=111878 RepID=A0AAV7JG39_9METZ|nr:Zinc finger MYM-type protein 1-like [Oopsacas minuta]